MVVDKMRGEFSSLSIRHVQSGFAESDTGIALFEQIFKVCNGKLSVAGKWIHYCCTTDDQGNRVPCHQSQDEASTEIKILMQQLVTEFVWDRAETDKNGVRQRARPAR